MPERIDSFESMRVGTANRIESDHRNDEGSSMPSLAWGVELPARSVDSMP